MKDLFRLTGTEGRKKIISGEITAKALTESCLDRIEATDSQIKAWVCYDREKAVKQAVLVDEKIAAKKEPGKLAGIPVGVKDIFNTADFPTCMGSPIWKGFTPGNDARVVFYIRQEDAVIPGKTTTAEFAVHAPAETINPHNAAYSPGTSSSGSAAAVASFQVPLAFGTQTAGSIIRPASYCGVIGYKPSFAVIPRTGALKTTDSLDTIGMFARSVDDIELLFGVMRVSGPNFPFVQNYLENPDFQAKKKGEPWKVLLITDQLWVWENADPYAKEAIQNFAKSLSKEGVIVETPKLSADFNKAHEIHSVIYDKTLAYYFKEEHKQHTLISKVMYEIISRGQKITLDRYKQALEDQNALIREADRILSQYDAIVTLSTTGEAPKFGGDDRPDSALIWTLCQIPSLNLPLFKSPNQMPFGLQLVSRKYTDYKLLNFARFIEQKFGSEFYLNRKQTGAFASH